MSAEGSMFSDLKHFIQGYAACPLVRKLDIFKDPLIVYRALENKKTPGVLLESARCSPATGQYSFIGRNPFLTLEAWGSEITLSSFGEKEVFHEDPFKILRRVLGLYTCAPRPNLPAFVGGAVGYFGYESKNYLEPASFRSFKGTPVLPDVYLLFFDEGVVIDHEKMEMFIFSTVHAGKNLKKCFDSAMQTLNALENELRRSAKPKRKDCCPQVPDEKADPLIDSSMSRPEFIQKVKKIKQAIRRGDIYQANLSQRFSFTLGKEPLDVYENLRKVNPSPFFGFLDALDFQIVSGSPERLLKLENGVLETRPIAGTRARGKNEKEDEALSKDLILNPKERAEHIMLVDLERNDLGRVSEYGSVSVNELMGIENYSHVKHIVSNVRSRLKKELDAVEAFKAFFPGGTITGTPKIRCMEILDTLEPVERGPYTGSLGYFSFTGNMDFNIIIRSLVIKNGTAHLQVGAGIVADSIPGKEYEETLYKAEGLLTAIFGKQETRAFFRQRGVTCRVS